MSARPKGGLAAVVAVLGGELYAGGRRALVPGPGHSRADRSASLLMVGDRVVAHSFAGDDWRAILADLRARGLIDDGARLAGTPAIAAAPAWEPLPRGARVRRAQALWAEARTAEGTLAAQHARLRSVRRPLGTALRFHAGVPAAAYAARGPRRPALLAAICDRSGQVCGVEVTYLGADGQRAQAPTPRKTLGARPPGAAVRIDPAAPALLVGEGVFSCLSASEALGLPAWALLAAGNLRAWRPPPEVRRVVIAADRGRTGEGAARELAERLAGARVAVEVRLPPGGALDWNAAAAEPAHGGGGEAREGGPDPGDRLPAVLEIPR